MDNINDPRLKARYKDDTNSLHSQLISPVLLREQQHGSHIFVPNNYDLAPKFKYQFHVAFNINTSVLKKLNSMNIPEISLLVKNTTLPSFTMATVSANQYNRKKYIQTQHKLIEVDISFHDDNVGIIHKMWKDYYGYYYADPASASNALAYSRSATKSFSSVNRTYGLDNNIKQMVPFFNYITIYQLSRHEYVSYKLINPMIGSWGSSKVDYSEVTTGSENTMKVGYEAVEYDNGVVEDGVAPENFAMSEYYDLTPSPIDTFETLLNSNYSLEQINEIELDYAKNAQITANQYFQSPKYAQPGILTAGRVKTQVDGLQYVSFPKTVKDPTIATPINTGKK